MARLVKLEMYIEVDTTDCNDEQLNDRITGINRSTYGLNEPIEQYVSGHFDKPEVKTTFTRFRLMSKKSKCKETH